MSTALRPFVFVLLWSTGYVAGPLALRDTGPFTLLALRFGLAAVGLVVLAVAGRAVWPRDPRALGHLAVAGLLSQAVQFAALYDAITVGVPAAVIAVIVGMMPIATAIAGRYLLGEVLAPLQWVGFGVGFAGVVLVVGSGLAQTAVMHLTPLGVALALVGLAGITAGTVYQKRFCAALDVRSGAAVQTGVAALVMLVLARGVEPMHVVASSSFVAALAWLVVVNSIVTMLLLFLMIRDGEVNRVATTFYLIPPVSAVMTALVLHDRFTPLALAGFVLAAVGVALATRLPRAGHVRRRDRRAGIRWPRRCVNSQLADTERSTWYPRTLRCPTATKEGT
jgi:drug/metabolite transporter (DMT)-like permease